MKKKATKMHPPVRVCAFRKRMDRREGDLAWISIKSGPGGLPRFFEAYRAKPSPAFVRLAMIKTHAPIADQVTDCTMKSMVFGSALKS